MNSILILRPEPGASESAARARKAGLDPVTVRLFAISPLPWQAPDPASFDAVLMTSANAARHGGEALSRYRALPSYVTGAATAAAVREAGFRDVRAGDGDGASALALARRDGAMRILHLCGRDHKSLDVEGLRVTRRLVYAADPVGALPTEAVRALAEGPLVLLHSPRAAACFADLFDKAGLARSAICLAAISRAAADAAGAGWRAKHAAAAPSNEALLELAAKLCHIGPMSTGSGR